MTLEGIGLIKEAKNFLVDLKSCCSFGDLKEYYEKLIEYSILKRLCRCTHILVEIDDFNKF